MIENKELTFQQTMKLARLQTWAMSLICGLLWLFVAAAATRIPHYLATSDYLRLIGVILFGLLVLAGLISIVQTHICLWRSSTEL